jgi:hypothetical protein
MEIYSLDHRYIDPMIVSSNIIEDFIQKILNDFYFVGSGEVKFSIKQHRKSIEKFIEALPTKYK